MLDGSSPMEYEYGIYCSPQSSQEVCLGSLHSIKIDSDSVSVYKPGHGSHRHCVITILFSDLVSALGSLFIGSLALLVTRRLSSGMECCAAWGSNS